MQAKGDNRYIRYCMSVDVSVSAVAVCTRPKRVRITRVGLRNSPWSSQSKLKSKKHGPTLTCTMDGFPMLSPSCVRQKLC